MRRKNYCRFIIGILAYAAIWPFFIQAQLLSGKSELTVPPLELRIVIQPNHILVNDELKATFKLKNVGSTPIVIPDIQTSFLIKYI